MTPFLTPVSTADAVAGAVARYFGVTIEQFNRRVSHRTVIRARMVAMWVVRHTTSMSFGEIGSHFGRDHSSIVVAVQKVDRALRDDSYLRGRLAFIVRSLGLPVPAKLLVEVPVIEQPHTVAEGQPSTAEPHLTPPVEEPPRLPPVAPQVEEKRAKRPRRTVGREAAIERAETPTNVVGRRAS